MAETVAVPVGPHAMFVPRHGAAWFRSVGSDDEPGTRLVTVSGAVRAPRVAEVAGGAPLADVLAAAGGPSEPLSAVLVGGYHGGWVPYGARAPHTAAEAPVDDASDREKAA